MPRKRKSDEHILNAQPAGDNGYEKGGRVLRVRDTCACPVCNMYFSPTEIQAHAQACLYFLEHEADVGKKKSKKGLSSSSGENTPSTSPVKSLSKSDSHIDTTKVSPSKSPKPVKTAATEWKPNTVAQWGIPYAPVYRPTLAEFKSPLEYINKIRPHAEKYGICVIIPPYPAESWSQHIGDPKTLAFRTKVQHIHQLKTRWQGRNEVFVSNLASFLEKRGEPLRSFPKVDGRDLDLYKLFTSVVNKGGYQVVERSNMWKFVADELKLGITCVRNNLLRNHYHKYLFAYEMHRKSKLQFRPASAGEGASGETNTEDDDLYIARDITDDLYNTDYLEEENAEDEFGFYEGEEYTLSAFEKKARSFSDKWFATKPTHEQVEEEFWRIVETAEDSVKVDYGSDIDVTKINRSGFSRDKCGPGVEFGPYITEDHTHWNLNHLPRMRGSVLSHIGETVAGVTDPMLYIGMLFSSFCWHTEDNYLYSINYMHKGTAKTWYGIPASAAEQFEEVMRTAVPDLFIKHPDLLHLLITMIAPSTIMANKVPIVRAVQEPGQYVITFPKAYHAGFSHGFTCAEAVNFAPADWLPYGHESVLHYRTIKRQSVFSHEELVCTIANRDPSPETAYWVSKELQLIRDREQSSRDNLRLAGYFVKVPNPTEPKEETKQCKICGYDCYLSYVSCECSPQYVACLYHHADLCTTCGNTSKSLKVLVPLTDLQTLNEHAKKLAQPRPKPVIDLTLDDEPTTSSPVSHPPPQPSSSNVQPSAPPAPSPSPSSSQQPMDVEKRPTSPSLTPASPKPAAPPSRSPSPTPMNVDEPEKTVNNTPPAATVNSVKPARSPSPSSPSSSPSLTQSPNAPKFSIVINLTQDKDKDKEKEKEKDKDKDRDKEKQAKPNPYENKIPPPPAMRLPPAPIGSVSSLTSQVAKQHAPLPSTPPSPSSSQNPSSTTPPNKSYTFHTYFGDEPVLQGASPPASRASNGTPPPPQSPHLSEHMQGIALNVPPSMAANSKPVVSALYSPKLPPTPKPVIVIDSPTKA